MLASGVLLLPTFQAGHAGSIPAARFVQEARVRGLRPLPPPAVARAGVRLMPQTCRSRDAHASRSPCSGWPESPLPPSPRTSRMMLPSALGDGLVTVHGGVLVDHRGPDAGVPKPGYQFL